MDEELWKDFRPDLHVEVLSSLSIRELCRLRTISPEWNNLAEQLVSRAWNDIMAKLKARPQATYMFRTPTTLDISMGSAENLAHPSWEVYDPNTRQCFPLNMQFLNTKDEFGRLRRVEEGCITIAADKGFICVVPKYPCECIKVVNPMTGSVVELPPLVGFNEFDYYYNRVVSLVVRDDCSAFSLYVVQDRPRGRGRGRARPRGLARQFDSNVGAWRELPLPSPVLWPSHMLHMESSLFTLFWTMPQNFQPVMKLETHLFVLDTMRTDSLWRETAVKLPQHIAVPQLATALGRLFFAAFTVDKIELVEVDVTVKSCSLVASMDDSHEFFKERKWLDLLRFEQAISQIVVVGCENFIVFSSVSGASVAYDLVNSKWFEWIQSSKIVKDADCVKGGLYGTSMSLTLHPVPAVHSLST